MRLFGLDAFGEVFGGGRDDFHAEIPGALVDCWHGKDGGGVLLNFLDDSFRGTGGRDQADQGLDFEAGVGFGHGLMIREDLGAFGAGGGDELQALGFDVREPLPDPRAKGVAPCRVGAMPVIL